MQPQYNMSGFAFECFCCYSSSIMHISLIREFSEQEFFSYLGAEIWY